MSEPRRVVITGIGLVSPLGCGREITWQRLVDGERATRWITPQRGEEALWPHQSAGAPAVGSPNLSELLAARGRSDIIPLTAEPTIAHAVTAALEAVQDADLDGEPIDSHRLGCVIGTSKGGVRTLMQLSQATQVPATSFDWWSLAAPSGPTAAVGSLFDARGAWLSPVSACATGLSSLVRGVELIQSGQCDVVISGSSDASLTPAIVASFRRLGVMARGFDDPASAVRPYDRNRNGFLVGEGAAVCVLESATHAESRGVSNYAEWLSGAMCSDAAGLTQLDHQPDALEWLIREVLHRGGLSGSDIDYISLHGTGTRMNDRLEMLALRSVLGSTAESVSGSSLKGAIGHLLGAAGSVEFAAMLLAMRDGRLPPTANLHDPDKEACLDLVPRQSRAREIQYAMKLSLGFGGHLVAAVVRKGTRPRLKM
jgi:3-oxoacyl-[acyl-carrier-protein] synthase II